MSSDDESFDDELQPVSATVAITADKAIVKYFFSFIVTFPPKIYFYCIPI